MNQMFLNFIEKEKPNCIFMWIKCDEFFLDTFLKIREISPKTQVILSFGDDEITFERFSRYLVLFLDYGLISQKKYLLQYHKDGIKNVFFVAGFDTNLFRPLNVKKKYDVTFIGAPKGKASGRYELIKFLKENNVKIKLFGWNWEKYPEFEEIYGGPLESNKMIEILNQSKINLCFSKAGDGTLQVTGKVFEAGACKTFILTEYCKDYLKSLSCSLDDFIFHTKNNTPFDLKLFNTSLEVSKIIIDLKNKQNLSC